MAHEQQGETAEMKQQTQQIYDVVFSKNNHLES